MTCDKIDDPVLRFSHIIKGRLRRDHQPCGSDRMQRHSGRARNKRIICCRRQRDANAVTTTQHQRNCRLRKGRDHFRQCKSGFYITTHSIEDHQKTSQFRIFLHCDQLRDQVLILGRFVFHGQCDMPLDASDDTDIL